MPKSKKKKRYENEEQILKDIDDTKRAANRCRVEWEIFTRFGDVMRDFSDFVPVEPIYSLTDYRELAEKRMTRAVNYETKKLRLLSEALAKMRTGIMPEIVTDKSFNL